MPVVAPGSRRPPDSHLALPLLLNSGVLPPSRTALGHPPLHTTSPLAYPPCTAPVHPRATAASRPFTADTTIRSPLTHKAIQPSNGEVWPFPFLFLCSIF
ncbi:hypothetical protein ACQJBY_006078 [Aegilops geniculata]